MTTTPAVQQQEREWHKVANAPVLNTEYISYRPASIGVGEPPKVNDEGLRYHLPMVEVNSITVVFPKITHENTNYRVTDHSYNEWVEHMSLMSYVREKLNGNCEPRCFEETEDSVRIETNSQDIIKLWCRHHRGEFVGHANLTFGSMPMKMEVNVSSVVDAWLTDNRVSAMEDMDKQTPAWDYANEWNYVIGEGRTLWPIVSGRNDFRWINNFHANALTFDLIQAEEDDA